MDTQIFSGQLGLWHFFCAGLNRAGFASEYRTQKMSLMALRRFTPAYQAELRDAAFGFSASAASICEQQWGLRGDRAKARLLTGQPVCPMKRMLSYSVV
ncbi:hypothetical protein [uncultured Paracoccus sp.]|uniref:hypothetical protein n=1 Tax=uncultured Paracoccus sp. TaxID=189685 RepID=UPI0026025F6C|nr:hypothetical protein [uncultured Paracoccus sp.]